MQDILSFTMQYVISDGSGMKNLPANAGDMGLIPGLERYPGEENRNPVQYSHLGNSMNRGTWWAVVHGVTKSQTRLSDFHSLILYTYFFAEIFGSISCCYCMRGEF